MAPSKKALADIPIPQVAGTKRSAPGPTLLPAFEPSLSSPSLPRPAKRVARDSPTRKPVTKYSPNKLFKERRRYPSPFPTSSTGIVSSSPPNFPSSMRPRPRRVDSTPTGRVPLGALPTVELDIGGEPTLMGRSGKSSHYQLSSNKLISRVHVRAAYVAAAPPHPASVELVCMGWNGIKVHCQGRSWEVEKDDSFRSEAQDADIMVDVQDARVILQWPKIRKRVLTPADTDSAPDIENSPSPRLVATHTHSPLSSPLRQRRRLQSPVSPSPAVAGATLSSLLFPASLAPPMVQVYEDQSSDDDNGDGDHFTSQTQSTQRLTQTLGTNLDVAQSQAPLNFEEFSDQDEENDPVVHSFGPFGANLLPRMASFTTEDSSNPRTRLSVLQQSSVSPSQREESENTEEDSNPAKNHVINQLAYSRLSSTPLSTIMGNLPIDLNTDSLGSKEKKCLSVETLHMMLDMTACIGKVIREGKDAAGKALESEYYYVPELDSDEKRRDAVVQGLQKPGLRACRKQHKQYYWRKPK